MPERSIRTSMPRAVMPWDEFAEILGDRRFDWLRIVDALVVAFCFFDLCQGIFAVAFPGLPRDENMPTAPYFRPITRCQQNAIIRDEKQIEDIRIGVCRHFQKVFQGIKTVVVAFVRKLSQRLRGSEIMGFFHDEHASRIPVAGRGIRSEGMTAPHRVKDHPVFFTGQQLLKRKAMHVHDSPI